MGGVVQPETTPQFASSSGVAAGQGTEPVVPVVLTVDEVAALLRVNRKTIYDLVQRRELPGARKVGRCIRFHRDTVLHWLAGQGRVSRSSRRKR